MRTTLLLLITITSVSPASTISVVERGQHHAVWGRVAAHKTMDGRTFYTTNSYTELATGKHYQKGGQWVPAVAEIAILPSGFGVATQLQHKVIFAPNINTAGAIDCLTPDDKRLRGHVLGLAYTDKSTGRGVMIAEIRDTTGVLVSQNQVLYPDAFDSEGGFRADIRYTVTLAGLEQDIILVESPPDPLLYGIAPENCRLEVYSEFVEAPEVSKSTTTLDAEANPALRQAMVEPDLTDDTLVLGQMRMNQGVAFRFGNEDPPETIPMGKTWEQRENRQLLIEKVNFTAIQAELQRLPQVARLNQPKKTLPLKGRAQPAWASFLPAKPPKEHAVLRKLRGIEMAQAHLPRQGFVLDYQLLNANTNNFTFRGDTTYFVSAQVIFTGTTVFEGGSVIKCTNGTLSKRVWTQGPLDCRTSPYHPAIFTAKDDNTVGETIFGSTGNPAAAAYGQMLDFTSNTNPINLHNVALRYAHYGVNISSVSDLTLSHAQIGWTHGAVVLGNGKAKIRNTLIHDSQYALGGSTSTFHPRCEQVTFHRLNNLRSSTTSYLTNCLVMAVTNNLFFSGSNNETNINDAGVFQVAGWGLRYLASASAYRNAGTTNIDPGLLAELRQRTTYPPLLLTNDVTIDTTLSPQAQRDTDGVDLGYHYPVLDWIVRDLSVTGATLRVSGGASISIDVAATNSGIRLESGATLLSEGTPVNLNRFVRTHCVQEIPSGSGTSTVPMFADTYPAPSAPATINLRFTDIPQIQKHYLFNQPSGQGTLSTLILRDSQFRGGTNSLQPAGNNQFIAWTNLLVENSGWFVSSNATTTLHLRNATFKSGALTLDVASGCTWSVEDCIFDYTALTNFGPGTLTHDYNGYLTNAARLLPTAANDVVLATNIVDFQTGTLGGYYLPTNSLFIDAGSVTNAGFAGLWHYTTQTNQTKDAATRLDLGFHYVALNLGLQPVDTDGDGIADYREDQNGNGVFDTGETDWQTYNSPNGLSGGSGLEVYTPLK